LINALVDTHFGKPLNVPLALLYLGTVLRQHNIPSRLFDFQDENFSWHEVEEAIANTSRCLVGFRCDSENIHRVLQLSDRLISRYSNVTVVLGGVHVTHIWEPYVTSRRLVVRGEGEYPLILLSKFFLNEEGSLDTIPGIAYEQGGTLYSNSLSLGPYEDVNSIPFPDFSLLPAMSSYSPVVITGRGCPYQCHFCSQGGEEFGYRQRNVSNIEKELQSLKEHYKGEIPYLLFCDDTFTVSVQRVLKLCDAIDRVFPDKSRFGFFCEGRVNILAEHPELMYRLKEAGLLRMQIGIESGNQAILDRLNKDIRVEQIEKVVSTAYEAGIYSLFGNFMCGLPGQKEEDIEKEITFAKHLVDLAPGRLELSMSILTPFPGTEFRINASTWGISIVDEDFVTGRMAVDSSFIETAALSKRQIERFCVRFKSEIEMYQLEKAASSLSFRDLKEFFVLAADRSMDTVLVRKLSRLDHANWVLYMRNRRDHRFLFEIPDNALPVCSPLSAVCNSTKFSNGGTFIINENSAMEFELSNNEMRYYECFSGKLSFKQIAQRIALKENIAEEKAFDECVDVYLKCEDNLAAIIIT
jgi:radical SAM superfamily enzyme YgiQ (UPF0313 family)